jgi:hypothetical protein
MRWLSGFLLALSLGMIVPGCEEKSKPECPPPETSWVCLIDLGPKEPCPSSCQTQVRTAQEKICASSESEAEAKIIEKFNAEGYTTTLTKTKLTMPACYEPNFYAKKQPQTIPPPSCDEVTGDNGCQACAKIYCCADYQACFQDANCLCFIACMDSGGTVDSCTKPETCGAADAILWSTATCLNTYCPGPCLSMSSMGSTCLCPPPPSSSSSSGGGGGSPGCGPKGPAEACFSDSECASCVCDVLTQTCD